MANNRPTIASVDKKVAVLENTISINFKNFQADISEIKNSVNGIIPELQEVNRRVTKHHSVFHEHSKIIDELKKAECPARKVMPEERPSDGNGGYIDRRKRKSWRKQFKEMTFTNKLKVMMWAIPLLIIYWEWIFSKLGTFIDWLGALPK